MAPAFGWRGGVAYGLGAGVMSRGAPSVFVPREAMFAPRVAAHVVVGDRVPAIASGTTPYVRAEPTLPGHPVAQGVMHGPTPSALGIPAAAIVHVAPGDRGVLRASAYARPSTAQALGARAPSPHVVRVQRGGRARFMEEVDGSLRARASGERRGRAGGTGWSPLGE